MQATALQITLRTVVKATRLTQFVKTATIKTGRNSSRTVGELDKLLRDVDATQPDAALGLDPLICSIQLRNPNDKFCQRRVPVNKLIRRCSVEVEPCITDHDVNRMALGLLTSMKSALGSVSDSLTELGID